MGMKWKKEMDGKLLEVQVSGRLAHEDCARFAPEFDQAVKEHGLVNVLCDMVDFQGLTPGALWDDIKLDLKHHGDVKKMAVVGDKQWEKWMTMCCRPFTAAQVRYYDHSQMDEARNWVETS